MPRLKQLQGSLNSISIDRILSDIISTDSIKNIIKDLQRAQLSTEEIRVETPSGGGYAESTIKIRSSLGLQTNLVDLNFTGEFYRTLKVNVGSNFFDIVSGSSHEIGANNLGEVLILTDNNIEILASAIMPLLNRRIRTILRL